MGGLKKLFKKARKALKLPPITAANVGRVAAAVVTRGKSEKVVQSLKGVGDAVKAIKGAPAPRKTKSIAAVAAKVAKLQPKIVGISKVQATAMPGGAPIKAKTTRRRRSTEGKADKINYQKPKKAKAAKPKAARKAPKGGLDLKGLSASWKAAGKPGTWAGWIKKNSR